MSILRDIFIGPSFLISPQYYNYTTITALDTYVMAILRLPKDGIITHIGISVAAKFGSPSPFNVGITTLNNYIPTSNPYGGSSIETFNPPSAGYYFVSLTNTASATKGDLVAAGLWSSSSGTYNTTNTLRIGYSNLFNFWSNTIFTMDGVSKGIINSSRISYSNTTISPFAIKYSDGSIYGVPSIYEYPYQTTIGSGGDADEVGNIFTCPVDIDCTGIFFNSSIDTGNLNFDVVATLYDADDNILISKSVVPAVYYTYDFNPFIYFDNSIQLSQGSIYKIGVKLQNYTTDTVSIWRLTLAPNTRENIIDREGNLWIHFTNFEYYTRIGSSTFYETDRLASLSIIGKITSSGSGGGGGGTTAGGAYAYAG